MQKNISTILKITAITVCFLGIGFAVIYNQLSSGFTIHRLLTIFNPPSSEECQKYDFEISPAWDSYEKQQELFKACERRGCFAAEGEFIKRDRNAIDDGYYVYHCKSF